MIAEILLKIFGTILFFLPGVLLSFVLFRKLDFIERTAYSIVLSFLTAIIIGTILAWVGKLFPFYIITVMILLNLLLAGIVYIKKNSGFSTEKINLHFILILVFSLAGAGWRYFFYSQANAWGDGIITHVNIILENAIAQTGSAVASVPNLNFYTGIVQDHASFIGSYAASIIFKLLSFNSKSLELVLAVLILSSFAYIAAKQFTKDSKLALFCAAVMALGPIEIWHSSLSPYFYTIYFMALISLFIMFKTEEKGFLWFTFIFAFSMMVTNYTASLVMMIASIGFVIALALKNLKLKNFSKSFFDLIRQKKFISYIAIILLLFSFIFLFAGKSIVGYTSHNIHATVQNVAQLDTTAETTIPEPVRPYKPAIMLLGLTPLTWQGIYLLFLGLNFVIYFLIGKNTKDDWDIAYSIIPVVLVGLSFLAVNYVGRAFSYLVFFALLSVKIPKKSFNMFAVLSIIFLVFTGFFAASQTIEFLTNSNGEIAAANWAAANLDGRLLSDERFLSLVIQKGYYNVTGFEDNSVYVMPIFYRNSSENASVVFAKLNTTYFADTKRMRENYILMLNSPQQPIENSQMYEDNFKKIYDNGDVRVYKIK